MTDAREACGAATAKEAGLWLLESLLPSPGINNIATALRVATRLDLGALHAALARCLDRHVILRTVFWLADGALVKAVLPVGCSASAIEHRATNDAEPALRELAARPFALDRTPLVRVAVLRGAADDTLCVVAHHLIFDAISAGVLVNELVAHYNAIVFGGDAGLPPVADAVDEPAPRATSLAYWRDALRGIDPDAMALAYGTPTHREPRLAGRCISRDLAPATRASVLALARELRAPESVILLATFYLLLAAHGAGPDLVVGSPVNTRTSGAPAIGYHVNTLALRVHLDRGRDFRALVAATRKAAFDGFAHADVAIDALYAELPRAGAAWRTTLFRHMFNYLPQAGDAAIQIAGHDAVALAVENGYSKFDFELFVTASPHALALRAVYCTDVLSDDDAARLLARYEALLDQLAAEPGRLLSELPRWTVDAAADTAAAAADAHAQVGDDDPLLATLVALWRELIGVDDITRDTHFFLHGGHSMLAARLAQQVKTITGARVRLADIFAHPTPIRLAAHLRAQLTPTATTDPL